MHMMQRNGRDEEKAFVSHCFHLRHWVCDYIVSILDTVTCQGALYNICTSHVPC